VSAFWSWVWPILFLQTWGLSGVIAGWLLIHAHPGIEGKTLLLLACSGFGPLSFAFLLL
jgi:hypothetical protein